MPTFWPSTKPNSRRPARRASTRLAEPEAGARPRNPITGTAGCCASAARGQVNAPTKKMKLRRFMSPFQSASATSSCGQYHIPQIEGSGQSRFAGAALGRKSLRPDAGILHDLAPVFDLLPDERTVSFRRSADRHRADLAEGLLHLIGSQHLVERSVQPHHDVLRRAALDLEADPF